MIMVVVVFVVLVYGSINVVVGVVLVELCDLDFFYV